MLRKQSRVKIYDGDSEILKFDISLTTSVEISSSRETFTDTCALRFPNKLRDRDGALERIRIGDRVEVFLGYFPELLLEFTGFINYINPDSPLELLLEDQAFQLKRNALPARNFRDTTLSEVVSYIYSGEVVLVDAQIGDLRIPENVNAIEVLDELKSNLGILSYFQGGILYVNADLSRSSTDRIFLVSEQNNVPSGGSSLKFQDADDLQIVSHGVSVQRDGTKIERYAYYKNNVQGSEILTSSVKPIGTLNTLKIPNLSQDALDNLIARRLPQLFYTGITGEVETFGAPSMRHGDTIEYRDERTPQKNGRYRLDSVSKIFDESSGYRQKLTLGIRTGSL